MCIFYNMHIQQCIVGFLVLCSVAKEEHSHPTWTLTRVYRVPYMHSDRNAKEPKARWYGSPSTYSSLVTSGNSVTGGLHLKATSAQLYAKRQQIEGGDVGRLS